MDNERTPQDTNNIHIDIERTAHAGNLSLPPELYDPTRREFDKTSLEEAVNSKLIEPKLPTGEVTIQPLIEAAQDNEKPTPLDTQSAKSVNPSSISAEMTDKNDPTPKKPNKVAVALGSAGAALVVIAGGIFGVNLANGGGHGDTKTPPEKDDKTPVATPSETSTPPSTPSAEVIPLNSDPMPAELQPIANLSEQQLSQQPLQVRLKLASYYNRNEHRYAQQYEQASGDPADTYPTAPASLTSSPQDILLIAGYKIGNAFTQPDRETAKKDVLVSTFAGLNSIVYQQKSSQFDQLQAFPTDAKGVAVANWSVPEKLASATDVQTDADGNKFRDITSSTEVMDINGNIQTIPGADRYYYEEYTDYKGQPAATWIAK